MIRFGIILAPLLFRVFFFIPSSPFSFSFFFFFLPIAPFFPPFPFLLTFLHYERQAHHVQSGHTIASRLFIYLIIYLFIFLIQ